MPHNVPRHDTLCTSGKSQRSGSVSLCPGNRWKCSEGHRGVDSSMSIYLCTHLLCLCVSDVFNPPNLSECIQIFKESVGLIYEMSIGMLLPFDKSSFLLMQCGAQIRSMIIAACTEYDWCFEKIYIIILPLLTWGVFLLWIIIIIIMNVDLHISL